MSQTNYIEDEILDVDSLVENKKSTFSKTTFFKLEKGANQFRLLLNPAGKPHFVQHWVNWFSFDYEKDDGTVVKTYRSAVSPHKPSEGIKSAIKEKSDALTLEQEKLALPYTSAKKVNTDAMPKDVLAKYKALGEQIRGLKAQGHYYVNAVDKSGALGILRIPSTAHDALQVEIKKLVESGKVLNPLSLTKGVWFEFTRSGDGLQTKYGVQVHRVAKEMQGETVEVMNKSALPEDLIKNYPTLGKDVRNLFRTLTYEESQKLVAGDYSVFTSNRTAPATALNPALVTAATTPAASAPAAKTAAPKAAAPVAVAPVSEEGIEFEEINDGVDTIDLN